MPKTDRLHRIGRRKRRISIRIDGPAGFDLQVKPFCVSRVVMSPQ